MAAPSGKEFIMNEWLNETLVAIEAMTNGKYRVIELPARATQRHISKRRFATAERAEDYIAEQYNGALTVQPEDIAEEIERRNRPAPHPLLTSALERMQSCLDELEAMPPLPKAGTVHGEAHEAWIHQHEKMNELYESAKNTALWLVPIEVQSLLHRIQDQYYYHGRERGDKDNAARD